ncbi:hypothetical protein GQ85_10970 [Rhodococcus rhodochrous]|nr:hypothetical protein GQ85_10970 [Rhodococcus rhodochrous]
MTPDVQNVDRILEEVRLLRGEFHDGLRRLEDRHVSKDVYANLVQRVGDLEGTLTWLGRAVVGLVLVAVIGLVLTAGPAIGR